MDIKELIENYKNDNDIYKNLTIEHISDIFKIFLGCPNQNGCVDCLLDNNKIGCFRLRSIAMQKIIDMNESNSIIMIDKGEPQCQK